jgi:hypothetical protein
MNSALFTRDLWKEAARSTKCWSELLTIPGGSGKGEKCFGYLIDYEWNNNGRWQYAPVPEMELEIVLPDGSTEGIALLYRRRQRELHWAYVRRRMETTVITFRNRVKRRINGNL